MSRDEELLFAVLALTADQILKLIM